MRPMYDAVTATNIPVDAEMVAGYVDGNYKWSDSDWARFPNSVKVRVAVFSTTNDGHVLDVEPGNANIKSCVDWVLMRRKSGVDPSIYCSQGEWQAIIQEFATRGVVDPHWWIANWNTGVTFPNGAMAFQYSKGDAYDLSHVRDFWPGIDPAPKQGITKEQIQSVIDEFTTALNQLHSILSDM